MPIRSSNHSFRLLATLAVAGLSLVVASATAHAAPRVTNGTKVDRAAFDARWSSIVSVQQGGYLRSYMGAAVPDRSLHQCGGTLIAPDLVVTAAHCVGTSARNFTNVGITVLANTLRLSGTSKTRYGVVVGVSEVVVHPSYRVSEGANAIPIGLDIALLKLDRAVPGAHPMAIIGAGERAAWGGGNGLPVGAAVAGWGSTIATERDSFDFRTFDEYERYMAAMAPQELRQASLPLLPDRLCGSTDSFLGDDAPNFEPETMLCGGAPDTKRGMASDRVGSCQGDSGGPLAVTGTDGAPRLAGIVSWGPDVNGPCDRGSVYTRVDAARDWIAATAAAIDAEPTPAAATDLHARLTAQGGVSTTFAPPATATKVRLLRETSLIDAFSIAGQASLLPVSMRRALAHVAIYEPLASAGPMVERLGAAGLAPARAGASHRLRLRLEVEDALGRSAMGPVVIVQPRIDQRRPSAPSAPRVFAHRYGVPFVRWSDARDNDCVASYLLQVRDVRFSRTWQTVGYRRPVSCPGTQRDSFNSSEADPVWPLYSLYPGRNQIRVVAIDRAGNARASRVSVVHTKQYVPDPTSPCNGFSQGSWATVGRVVACASYSQVSID
ncbi:MAG: serine protease [Thermoleophilia bacterium]|nr:serine protease [Thermoleophilia bacterium]